jgi:predicted nucleic acid-binding protein
MTHHQPDHPDPGLLAAARAALGTSGDRETLEAALALAVRRRRRERAVTAEVARLGAVAEPGRDDAPGPGADLPPRGWLLDESARVAAGRDPAVAAALRPLLAAGLLHTCPLLDLVALTAEPGGDLRDRLAERRLAYRSAPAGPGTAERAIELHRLLVRHAHPQVATPADLLVAATALEHDLGVLHHRPAFTLLGTLAGLRERPVPVPSVADQWGRAS